MPRTCTICRHPERAAIDRALVRGAPYRGIAQQFKLPSDPVYRHMQAHLPQLLRNAAGLQDLIDGKRLLNELIDLHQLTMELLAEARENDRPTVALKAITVARGNIALMLKAVLPRAEQCENNRRFDELYGNPLDALLRQADAAD